MVDNVSNWYICYVSVTFLHARFALSICVQEVLRLLLIAMSSSCALLSGTRLPTRATRVPTSRKV
jgi:hypothetical protein